MSSGQKVAVSLLVSVLIFSAIAVAAFAGLFSFVEARFYQPLVVKTLEQRLQTVAEKQDEYSSTLSQRFNAFAADKSVASYALSQASADQQKSRTDKTGALLAETPALRGIRIVDANGRSVHFSSFAADIKQRTKNQISYKNYPDFQDIPFAVLACADSRNSDATDKILLDQEKNRVIYAFPFYDTYNAYRGTIAFYCDGDDLSRFLVAQGAITLNDTATIAATPLAETETARTGGYVLGLPAVGRDVLTAAVLEKLAQPSFDGVANLLATDTGNWVVFARPTQDGAFVARVVGDDILLFPNSVRLLLLAIVFVTLYLTVFLIFNVKHDDMVVIKDRIRRFQLAFITEYLEKQSDGELKTLPADIANRKSSLNTDIKRSLGRRAKKHEKEVDELLERNWDEILGAIGAKPVQAIAAPAAVTDTAELKRMLEEVLSSGNVHVQATVAHPVSRATPAGAEKTESVAPIADADVVEELDEVEEIADAEEVADIEEITEAESVEEIGEAEPLDEVEEITDAEEVESLDELEEELGEAEEVADAEVVEELGEVEEITDADVVEEITEAESLDEAEEITDAEEVEPLDTVEELNEAEEVSESESVEEIEEVESLDEVEEIADAEVVEELEEIADAESVGEIEEAESLDEAEEIADAEVVEEIEEISTAEEITETEEIEPLAPATEAPAAVAEEPIAVAEQASVSEIPAAEIPPAPRAATAPAESTVIDDIPDETAVPASQQTAVAAFLEEMRKPNKVNFVDLGDIMESELEQTERSDFTETLGFSSPTMIHGLNTDFIADTFKVSPLDFSELDTLDRAEAENGMLQPEESDEPEPIEPDWSDPPFVPLDIPLEKPVHDDVEDVPLLESSDEKTAFLFSSFGRNDTHAVELLAADTDDDAPADTAEPPASGDDFSAVGNESTAQTASDFSATATDLPATGNAPADESPADAIIADADGTFRIAERLPPHAPALDARFKALVDSVLQ